MKVSEVTNKLAQNGIAVKNSIIDNIYILKLSNRATLHLWYRNNDIKEISVKGKDECVEQTKKILGIKE